MLLLLFVFLNIMRLYYIFFFYEDIKVEWKIEMILLRLFNELVLERD